MNEELAAKYKSLLGIAREETVTSLSKMSEGELAAKVAFLEDVSRRTSEALVQAELG